VVVSLMSMTLMIALTVYSRRHGSIQVTNDLISWKAANTKHAWRGGRKLAASSVTIPIMFVMGNKELVDPCLFATPNWFGFNHTMVPSFGAKHFQWNPNKTARDQNWDNEWSRRCQEHLQFNAEDEEGRPQAYNGTYNQTFYHEYTTLPVGTMTIPCHVAFLKCDDYEIFHGVEKVCDDDYLCGSSNGYVNVVKIMYQPWVFCFTSSMALVNHFTTVITVMVVCLYMCILLGLRDACHKSKRELSRLMFSSGRSTEMSSID